MRYKGVRKAKPKVKILPPVARARILGGEPWLRVWSQQLAVPMTVIAKRTRMPMARLIEIEAEQDIPSADELALIAAALGTDVASIKDVQD
jgi:hypothetical protein